MCGVSDLAHQFTLIVIIFSSSFISTGEFSKFIRFVFFYLFSSFFLRSTSPRMAYCPAVFTVIGDDVQLQESWTTWLSRWTPEELEWIKRMLEAHPDTTEKVLLVTAGSLSTWLGPIFLKWSRDFLVSVILLNKPFSFPVHNAPFYFSEGSLAGTAGPDRTAAPPYRRSLREEA